MTTTTYTTRTYCQECDRMVPFERDLVDGAWVCGIHGEVIDCSECGRTMDDDHDGAHEEVA